MLSRLKTLPLTIALTILIWMYAEAQFASKRPTIMETEAIPDVPVEVSGMPDVMARYLVELHPPHLTSLIVSGSPKAIQALRQRMANGGDSQIHVELDITPDDQSSPNYITRPLRYTLPEGLTLQKYPSDIEFRLIERP